MGRKNKSFEEGEVEVMGDDSGVSKEDEQAVVVFIDKGEQVITDESPPDIGLIRGESDDNVPLVVVPLVKMLEMILQCLMVLKW